MGYTYEDVGEKAYSLIGEYTPILMFDYTWKKNFNCESHWHSWIELIYVYSGSVEVRVDEDIYTLKAGDYIYINDYQVHETIHYGSGHVMVAQVMNGFIKNNMPEICDLKLRCCSCNISKSNIGLKKVIEKNLLDMYEAFNDKSYKRNIGVTGCFFVLIYNILKFSHKEYCKQHIKSQKYKERISKILDYINLNYKEDICLDSIALNEGVSPQYISKIFRKYLDTTFKSYLCEVRVQSAYSDLVNTDFSMLEISMKNGFPNQQSFINCFKKKYGMAPYEYKKNVKIKLANKNEDEVGEKR